MKRIISLFIIFATLSILICSCSLLPEEIGTCQVNFYVDGQLYDTKTVVYGQNVKMPDTPNKQNEIFVSWCQDQLGEYPFDFSKKVTYNMDLYAHFTIDAVSMTNMITSQTIRSIVTIENKCYNTVNGSVIESSAAISQGSGVVIDISGGYCYVLTNNHVVENPDGFAKQSFTVEDPWGNRYEAQIYKGKTKPSQAMSADYDLALLYFKYSETTEEGLEEIAFGEDPKLNEYIATIGTPSGLQNTLTYGQVLAYQPIKAGEDSTLQKITFDIIVHSAHMNHGSSGSALVNTHGQLVGINFAGYNDGTYGCTIPISKVIEFLNIFVY